MKHCKIGIMAAAILVVTGIGFGIAQAGGSHSERPILSFGDMESLEQGGSSSSYVETRPVLALENASGPDAETRPVLSFEDQELPQMAKPMTEDMENPIETGAIPATGSGESWMTEYGHD
jgi:hypothetical protein